MDLSMLPLYLGFLLAAYSVVGNDVIQTLGTFLASNEKRPWYVLWAFAGSILAFALIYGYVNADIDYGRLDKINIPDSLSWWYVLPPFILLFITRLGIPVSTTFLILTFFSAKSLPGMLNKSLMGYLIAFGAALVIYLLISNFFEKRFLTRKLGSDNSLWTNRTFWTGAQWFSTGFLWYQWLTQDLANIYVYLLAGKGGTGNLDVYTFAFSLIAILSLLAFIFYKRGGKIQAIVDAKTNTADIRSATFVDLIYGVVLWIFKYNALGLWEAKLPMSTTWVFIGLLAGREIGIRLAMYGKVPGYNLRNVGSDFLKALSGLVVSIILVVIMCMAQGTTFSGCADSLKLMEIITFWK